MSTPTLFDLDTVEREDDPLEVELRGDDTAFVQCRFCQVATTAAGLVSRGHGPDSTTCARYRATYGLVTL